MNALVGLAAPGQFGGDVSHLNLAGQDLGIPTAVAAPVSGPVAWSKTWPPCPPPPWPAGYGTTSGCGVRCAFG